MRSYQPYVVKPGDYLAKLAHIYDFEVMEVWNHPLNAELRAKRGSPDILYPGDVLYIPMEQEPRPGVPVKARTTNTYVTRLPTIPLTVAFRHGDAILASEPCQIHGLAPKGAKPPQERTDAKGILRLQITPATSYLEVVFPRRGLRFPLYVGTMDPIEERSGVAKRLANLAYLSPQAAYGRACPPELLDRALRLFQRDHGLEPTGEAEKATRRALVQAHGS